jgi:thiamine biosynthesis lipoprotein
MRRFALCSILLLGAACQESSQTVSDPRRPLVEASATAEPAPAPSNTSDAAPIVIALTDGPFRTEKVSGDAHAMGTHVNYAAYTTPTVNAEATHRAFDAATAEIQRIETLMTTWRPDSDLSKVNAEAGKNKVKVDPETFAVVKESLHTSDISQGTFDITFESLHGLWKFDEDLDPHPPTADQVKAKLPLVGYKHVHLDETAGTIFIDQVGTKISLGGIAKGYAVDKAAKILADAGLDSFYVQAGGDLFAKGRKPNGDAWQAGIRDPRGPDGSFFALIDLSDHAFSTAGDYERSYVIGNKRYHHIIDPRTGFPATASRSVTIYAPTAYQADAIDDAVFILGPKKGLELVETLDDVGAVIVDDKNNMWVSKRLQGKVKLLRAPTGGI